MTNVQPQVTVIPAKNTEIAIKNKYKPLRVAAYCRVSTAQEEQQNSYQVQITYYTDLISKKENWSLAGVFADEGISGTQVKKRPEFLKMIRQCKKGKIDLILTKSISRFARNTVDCLEYVRQLKELGIGVIFEKENINTLTMTSEFMIALYGSFAQAESESISKNVAWGKEKAYREGKVNFQYTHLLGYKKGADGNPEIVPEEAETVQLIYKLFLDEYDSNGRLCKITNCYDEMTDQIVYNDNGSVNWLTNASGLKQVYTYNKAFKQTGLKEYDGETLIETFKYDYDEKYAVKTNTVETDNQTYEVDKITYKMVDGENKYDEMTKSVDIMGNTTKYDRDNNGNVIKTTYADGTYTLANYNDKNSVIAEVDEMGNTTIYAYDSNGTRLLKKAISLKPLPQSDISTVTAADFNPITYLEANESSYAITSHEYYANSYVSGIVGLIRATTDPEGNVTEYDYYQDGVGKGLVKSKTLKDDDTVVSTVNYEYNAQLQISKETTSYDLSKNLYSVKEYEYDKFNNITVTKDYGTSNTPAITITEYDLLSRKTAEYAPNYSANKSHGILTTYYPDGNKKTETDAEGNVTSYEYDAYGQVKKKVNPDGTMNLTEYDGLQREKATYFQSSESGTKQILTQTAYEFAGHSFDIYTELNNASSHSYKGLKTTKTTYITADKQLFTETLTDRKENVVYEKVNGETKCTSAYYANGQLARQTDALDNATKYEYNFLNKVTKTYTPFNGREKYSVTENQYDKNGNVIRTSQTVQKQDSDTISYNVSQNKYNAQGLLSQVTLSDGTSNNEKNITKYFYNNAGIQTKMNTGLNSESDSDYMTTSYEYDAWGRLIRTTDSTGYNSGIITYDLNGNVLTTTDANGNVTTNTYDALNRVLTANTVCDDTSKNVSKSYTYDNMGRITSTTSNDLTTTCVYDALGRKYTESEYNNGRYSAFRGYFYEGISQYVSEELTGQYHLLLYADEKYEYDNEMRIIKVLESGNETVSYTYDANGNKASETLANGVVSTYTYNNANRITNLVTKSGENTISEYEYSYYLDGSDACKIRKENGIIETTSYEYDGLKRLTKESVLNGSRAVNTYSYEYDDYGNRSKMVSSGTADYTTVYDYNDKDGNYTALLQKETKIVESDTNTTPTDGLAKNPLDVVKSISDKPSVENTTYTYDANGNQITKVTSEKTEIYTYDGLNQLIGFTDGEAAASYAYNVSGLRIEKTVDGETINHVWDGSQQIIADVVDNDFYEANCYLRGTNLVAKYNYFNGAKSEYTYYTQNAHGDVVNLTDESGVVTKYYTYDAFGVEQSIDDSDTNAFRYCGEYYDAEIGTVYLRARYYDPSIGRFIFRDSYAGDSNDPLSLNLYTYCHNNPVRYIDPTGHFIFEAIMAVTAVVCVALLASCGDSSKDESTPNVNSKKMYGAAEEYKKMKSGNSSTSPNCYAYALGLSQACNPGEISDDFSVHFNDINEVKEAVQKDLQYLGRSSRIIESYDSTINENEYRIALRVGTEPMPNSKDYYGEAMYDYHFMLQTNTGQWAEKSGTLFPSTLHEPGENPDTIRWLMNGMEYYDSEIIYFAITH